MNNSQDAHLYEDNRYDRNVGETVQAPKLIHGDSGADSWTTDDGAAASGALVQRVDRACFADILSPAFGGMGTHMCTRKCAPNEPCEDDNTDGSKKNQKSKS